MEPIKRAQTLWQRPGTGQLFTAILETQRPNGDGAKATHPWRLRVRMVSLESPWLLVLDR